MEEELMREKTGIPDSRNHKGEDSSICTGDNMWRESAAGVRERDETDETEYLNKKWCAYFLWYPHRFIPEQGGHLGWIR